MLMTPDSSDVLVIGGGVIGLATAWRLARRGIDVRVLEASPDGALPGAASGAAGGMLAPSAELQFEEVEFYRLQRESANRWPGFARELEADSGVDVDYRDEGTLMVAIDRDDAEAYRRIFRFQREQGLAVEWLSTADALDLEPFLSPRVAGAIFAPDDHGVDNRKVVGALRDAIRRNESAELVLGAEVTVVEPHPERPAARTADGGRFAARLVVVATGAWCGGLAGLADPLSVRPVKGQMLALRADPPFELRHVVRTPRGYVVPKSDGRLVVGATSEEMGFDTRVTGGGIYRLLEAAVEVLPGIEELPLVDTWAGLRPASRDHRPLLGVGIAEGVVAAAGHFRHGILLAPVTADELSGEIESLLAGAFRPSDWLRPFAPVRGHVRGTNPGVSG